MRFDELIYNQELLEAISFMGFTDATKIQEKAIPVILNNKDLMACAQTGTGKTAAFVIPLLELMIAGKSSKNSIRALIIVPTRELAMQIDQEIQGISYFSDIVSMAVYGGGGGNDWAQEREALTKGLDIVVATPGKLISHLKLGSVKISGLEHLILDEADKMLDMGFFEDIIRITSFLPKKRQTLMFSATMPPKIRQLTRKILSNPVEISMNLSKPAEGVIQAVYPVLDEDKNHLIKVLIKDKSEYNRILIFTSTKIQVRELVKSLKSAKINAEGLSSDLEQSDREEMLRQFKAGNLRVLVGTDVLSRGIDIKDIQLVINYNVPNDAEDYVHRVGRTARAEKTGVAITLVNPAEMNDFDKIEKLIEDSIPKIKLPFNPEKTPEWKVNVKYKPQKNRKKNYPKKKKSK